LLFWICIEEKQHKKLKYFLFCLANMITTINISKWKISGDWFDVCKCNISCPCIFAQPPSYGDCDGVLAYHINNGNYGEISLNELNVLTLSSFEGNIWVGNTKASIAIFF
jgi:hypothetical protein